MANLKLCVLISGRGSNLQSLIDACADNAFPAEIALVVSNIDGVQGLERAKKAGIPTTVLSHKDFKSRETFDASLTQTISRFDVDLLCLAGFMRILSDGFVNHWFDRLINIHPSLLPDYKGLHVHERVIEAGEDFSGCTVHYVRPDMDSGPIIKQAKVAVEADDNADTLAARVLEQEHIIYPEAVRLIAEGRVRIENECVVINAGT
ncbi:MAG: phosphoribosylglycinamide formyltransferase [Rhodospirillaceae bacterium]|jgi:phosphoribosylglycinamide formyltransferase 1|nr:phosphoribosylglycinamide formyltransferase [Rhodospirillaceae bacterium]MBT5244193.1 phosphoribosylglycinamide formyltransferase [Rhodospirillaceae bacterium]MBT5561718.1 phosphoribosylglycinamide formyltransferase [Rhodospirillaceae bacterium]MBT6243157.1 phosphoribosylglycinamide formyltransferase [Rhodospirillaceae bacterium]MBT7137450.1 phosphoribosylglycinamide formyltransferase [Rhodospirillaceae bacterium]